MPVEVWNFDGRSALKLGATSPRSTRPITCRRFTSSTRYSAFAAEARQEVERHAVGLVAAHSTREDTYSEHLICGVRHGQVVADVDVGPAELADGIADAFVARERPAVAAALREHGIAVAAIDVQSCADVEIVRPRPGLKAWHLGGRKAILGGGHPALAAREHPHVQHA